MPKSARPGAVMILFAATCQGLRPGWAQNQRMSADEKRRITYRSPFWTPSTRRLKTPTGIERLMRQLTQDLAIFADRRMGHLPGRTGRFKRYLGTIMRELIMGFWRATRGN